MGSPMLGAEFPPLLFTVPEPGVSQMERTPRSGTPHARTGAESSTLSQTRRSMTPPGSAHHDVTPPRPPPIRRLQEMSDDGGPAPPPLQSLAFSGSPLPSPPPLASNGAAAATSGAPPAKGGVLAVAQQAQLEDSWVTVFGCRPGDLPLVLSEFQKCGEVVTWGGFGAPPDANYLHVRYQNKYAAQRALLKDGEQLAPGLIVGVQPVDHRHRQAIEASGPSAGAGAVASPAPAPRLPARPYRVDMLAAQALPKPQKSLLQKVNEYILGV